MATFSAVTVCKNRLNDLVVTLPRLDSAGFDEVILVDYGCPQNSGDWARDHHPKVKILRYAADAGFNASRARNIGGKAASSDWIFFVDADIVINPGFIPYLKKHVKESNYYRTKKYPGNKRIGYGSFVVARDDFLRINGFDEVFSGWGCEDDDIFYRLDMSGLREQELPNSLIAEIATTEAARLLYSPIKTRSFQHALNRIYLSSKMQLYPFYRTEGDLPLKLRRRLYSAIQEKKDQLLELAQNPGMKRKFTFQFTAWPLRLVPPLSGTQTVSVTFEVELTQEQSIDETKVKTA
jgi:hypothetical protein